jgi:hypothetical protein
MKEKMKRKAFPISLQKRKEEQMICCSYHQKGHTIKAEKTNYVKNMKSSIKSNFHYLMARTARLQVCFGITKKNKTSYTKQHSRLLCGEYNNAKRQALEDKTR